VPSCVLPKTAFEIGSAFLGLPDEAFVFVIDEYPRTITANERLTRLQSGIYILRELSPKNGGKAPCGFYHKTDSFASDVK
jgi:hypothetical protein